ncbi:MAG: hypothetical protein IKI37_10820, partial [Oscillospiraceae bacterium]|nr:hypothetical protein [Oscillospiraceae bacterium]
MFGKTEDEILNTPESVMGAIGCTLEDDMLTIKDPPKHIIPYATKNTSFEAHPFFEASSMRKVSRKYYFVYSSWQNHELCYAVSDFPDKDFTFGGTIVSNGDIGYQGRTPENRLNMTGTTHGSIIQIQNQLYVFYHRLTHKSDYSRQACAERIQILPDGSIPQVEITSCGLNGAPLEASGTYPAVIACNITNGFMPHGSNKQYTEHFPHVTNLNNDRFIAEISDNTLLGYKYFHFPKNQKNMKIRLCYRADGQGSFKFYTDKELIMLAGEISIVPAEIWTDITASLEVLNDMTAPLFLKYSGTGEVSLLEFEFISDSFNPDVEKSDKSGFFMALCLVAGAGIFLAGASFLGRMLNQEEPPKTITTIEATTEKPTETVYFPPSATETENYKSSKTTITETSEPFSYASPRNGYNSGEYEIGKDIPSGTYIAVSDDAYTTYGEFVFGVYDKPYHEGQNMSSINKNVHHQNNYYIELEEGQYIHFSHSKLYPFSENADTFDPYLYSGMFKVYQDNIEDGVYTLIADSDYSGEYEIYDDIHANAEPIASGYLEEGETAEIILGETDYLVTTFCHVIEESYEAGAYTVGYDLPAGLYVGVNDYHLDKFLLEVYDENHQVIVGGYTNNSRYVWLKEGENVVILDGTLYNAKYTREIPYPYGNDGMYWVGHDIPEGTYTIWGNSSNEKNQMAIYDENLTLQSAKSIQNSEQI